MTAHFFPDNTVFCNFAIVEKVSLLEAYLDDRGRWTEAVAFEVGNSAGHLPDLAGVHAQGWMHAPIEIDGDHDQREVEGLRRSVFGGSKDQPLKHLGESQTLHVIRTRYSAGDAVWISDDRETIRYAAGQGIVVRETQHVVAELAQNGVLSDTAGLAMLQQMETLGRVLTIPAKATDLMSL